MILHRCFAWNRQTAPRSPDGPLWFPRIYQGDGRHDNPEAYGCLYVAETELSSVVEQLARFRGRRLHARSLVRRGLPLSLAAIEIPENVRLVDVDEPEVLRLENLRPSLVATRRRELTQPQALSLYRRHTDAAGLRWWSVFEALWANVTLFDRTGAALSVLDVRPLSLEDSAVLQAAELPGASLEM